MAEVNNEEILSVKPEFMHIYDIETNDRFLETTLTKEQMDNIEAVNKRFMDTVVQPLLLSHCAPCNCRMQEIMAKLQLRAQLSGKPVPQQIQLTQEDVDAREFGLIIKVTNGIPETVEAMVVGCTKCKSIQIFADADAVTRALAGSVNAIVTMQESLKQKNPDGSDPEFVMENLETGERVPADDLADALFGRHTGVAKAPDDLKLGDIPEPAPKNKVIDLFDGVRAGESVEVKKNED